ncbi:MAG: spore germination protein [Syntrophomonadaceae bacterium]|nr:spore germination protein [Syntrophomonadaceae bacterium]
MKIRRPRIVKHLLPASKPAHGPGETVRHEGSYHPQDDTLSYSLEQNIRLLKDLFGNVSDLMVRNLEITPTEVTGAVVWIDSLVDTKIISDHVLRPLISLKTRDQVEGIGLPTLLEFKNSITAAGTFESASMQQVVAGLLDGKAVVFMDQSLQAFLITAPGFRERSVEEPVTEVVVRGSREGFTESLKTNTGLVRKRLKTPHLRVETLVLGRQTNTRVNLLYLANIANPSVVAEARDRISRIQVDGVIESGYIEEMIEDAPFTLFPTIDNTERPDTLVAQLLEGRVGIMIDGTPFALTAPVVFWQYLQSSEDYYLRYPMASFIRILRYMAFLASLLLPSFYVAAVTFHQEMIPTPLLIATAAAREGVPFPPVLEALLMELTFEALREAGVRMPRPIGQAVSIVGALILGEAAIAAGIVSSSMVITVAGTAIASFVIPSPDAAIATRLLRFPMLLLAGTIGLFGILWGTIFMHIHLCTLRSFGVPYLSPVFPTNYAGIKDIFIRVPHWAMRSRPESVLWRKSRRQSPDTGPPHPPRNGG